MSASDSTAVSPRRLGPLQTAHYRRLRKAIGSPRREPVRVEHDVAVRMDDGVELLTNHWVPSGRNGAVVLIRTPYGRDGYAPEARLLAEAGHHVVVQSCRGHWGSGGVFDPMFDEERDGRACVRWIEQQDWFTGRIHTFGHSYVGLTQWALAQNPPPSVRGMVIGVSARSFRDSVLRHGRGFGIEMATTWGFALGSMELPVLRRVRAQLGAAKAIREGCDAIPPRDAVRRAAGRDAHFFHDWLDHGIDDEWWEPIQYAQQPASVPPITLVGGWYDMFIHAQVADYAALRRAGADVRLVVGPWSHMQPGVGVAAMGALWSQLGHRADDEARVRVQPLGSEAWASLRDWPPPSAPQRYYLDDAALTPAPQGAGGSRPLRFDPADPTPSLGGRSLNPFNCGPKRQDRREERDDVLTWTTAPLARPMLIAGSPVAQVIRSGAPDGDLFVRLCEVDDRGRSTNLADGFRRFTDLGGEPTEVTVSLGPLVARVAAGRRLRLQVSGGAHPQYLRHPGAGDPLGDFAVLQTIEQWVHCGANGTRLVLPVARFRDR